MNNVTSIAAGVQAGAARPNASAAKVVKAAVPAPNTEPSVDPATAMVDMTHSQVTYTASLNTLRAANKMMMGYLLNIKA